MTAHRCFGYGAERCEEPGTVPDHETPALFVDPDNPTGPTIRPVHCPAHHARIMAMREDNERSYRQAFGGFRR